MAEITLCTNNECKLFSCRRKSEWSKRGYRQKTKNFEFSISPGWHAQNIECEGKLMKGKVDNGKL